MNEPLFIADFDYHLPAERIAAYPLPQRDASKLLVYQNKQITDATFSHLPQFLPPYSTLVLNNTRVLEARLLFEKPTGGVIEIFCLEPHEPASMEAALQQTEQVQWRCLIGGASKWPPGLVLEKTVSVQNHPVVLQAFYKSKETDHFIIEFGWPGAFSFAEMLQAAGAVPLPPYIKRKSGAADGERYQTIFAAHKGSVAAPTASLHFTPAVFESLAQKNIRPLYATLHVGAGTFKPIKTETVAAHHMHGEHVTVSEGLLKNLLDAKTIVAAGTTSLRTLESLHWLGVKRRHGDLKKLELGQWEAYELATDFTYQQSIETLLEHLQKTKEDELKFRTSLLIQPGYTFKSAQALLTNFHQPRSTLLLLIAAFIGPDWKQVYEHALHNNYRFLSYGDSSLLWRVDVNG